MARLADELDPQDACHLVQAVEIATIPAPGFLGQPVAVAREDLDLIDDASTDELERVGSDRSRADSLGLGGDLLVAQPAFAVGDEDSEDLDLMSGHFGMFHLPILAGPCQPWPVNATYGRFQVTRYEVT